LRPAWTACPELAVLHLGWFEEGECEALLVLAQHVQGEFAGAFDDSVRAGISLDADHDQRWCEGALGHRIYRRRTDVALPIIGGHYVDPARDHAQRGLLGIGVIGTSGNLQSARQC